MPGGADEAGPAIAGLVAPESRAGGGGGRTDRQIVSFSSLPGVGGRLGRRNQPALSLRSGRQGTYGFTLSLPAAAGVARFVASFPHPHPQYRGKVSWSFGGA